MVRIQGATFGDVTDRATRLLGIASARGYAYDGSSWLELLADAYHRLGMTDLPWWVRKYGGRVVFMDDMEGTLKWTQETGTVTKDSTTTFVHSGSSALKGVTGATAGNTAAGIWYGPRPSTTAARYQAMGVHFCIQAAADTTPREFSFDLDIYDGSKWYHPRVKYLHYLTTSQKKLQYLSSTNVWTDITGGSFPMYVTAPHWHDMVLVTKRTSAAWEYYSLIVDGKAFDLSGVATYETSVSGVEKYITRIGCVTDAALATTFYADDFWLCDDMPAP